MIARHRKTASQTITEVLATLPLSSWENEFPALQLCLHETLRFTVLNPVYRKNTSGKSIPIGKSGEVIPPESYVVSVFSPTPTPSPPIFPFNKPARKEEEPKENDG